MPPDTDHDFEFAIYCLKRGISVKRKVWRSGEYIKISRGKIRNVIGKYTVEWIPVQKDILAEDWEEVIE